MISKHCTVIIFSHILLILGSLAALAGEREPYGLEFMAHKVEKESRTGLDLTSGKKIRISSGDKLEFDIRFREENESFGFIFRMVKGNRTGAGSQNIDLVSDLLSDNIFSIVMNRKIILQISKADINNLGYNDWHHVSVWFGKNSVSMTVDDFTKETNSDIDFPGRYNIYFGRNDDPEYFTREVPPMTIANIKLSRNEEIIGNWNLTHHYGNISPDTIGNLDATATNPVWNTDKFACWEKIAEFTVESRPQIAFSRTGDRLFIAKRDSLHIFNMASWKLSGLKSGGGEPFNTMSNNMVCLPHPHEKLISYCLETGKCTVFDSGTMSWSNKDGSGQPLPRFWHHNHCTLDDGRIAVFGGYGFHRYRSVLQVFYPDTWNPETDSTELSGCISPRYLSAMTHDHEGNLYVFGGYGSSSGSQREFPTNCFDLYKVNPNDGHCQLIRDFNPGEKLFTCSNSMVFSPDSLSFYVLTYNNLESSSEIQLKRIPLSMSDDMEDVGDCIPYYFNDTESYCDLAYYKDGGKLIAVTSHISKDHPDRSVINLYGINFPPVPLSSGIPSKTGCFPWWSIICLLGICLIPGTLVIRHRILQTSKNRHRTEPDIIYTLEKPDNVLPTEPYDKQKEAIHKSEISLLGGFQVFDADGQDITGSFTKTLKHLFLLILLYTVKDGKGISSRNLTDLLWFDKDEESARNNRNVNIRKLRILLSKIGGIGISNENSYWRIDTDPSVFSCDYIEVQYFMDKMKIRDISENERTKLLLLLSKGALLIFTQEEWVDSFKSDFSAKVINVMTALAKRPDIKDSPALMIKIADIILIHDSIDEDAVCMKCRALTELGRNGLARKTFDQFRSEYERLMGQQTLLTFEQATGIL